MTTKYPPYNFSVDSKKHPSVPDIIDMAVNKMGMKRSELMCQALEEWFAKRKERYLKNNVLSDEASLDDMLRAFETLLPHLTEPLSKFRYGKNKAMYFLMSEEMATHTDEVGNALIDGVAKMRQEFGKGFDERYDPRIKAIQEKEFSTHEEKVAALKAISREVKEDRHNKIRSYIVNQITSDQQQRHKTSEQRYEERIKELEEEIHRLSSSSSSSTKQEQKEDEAITQKP